MPDIESRARRLLSYCFSPEEFVFLRTNAEFLEATRGITTIEEALAAVNLGMSLLWKQRQKATATGHSQTNNTPTP